MRAWIYEALGRYEPRIPRARRGGAYSMVRTALRAASAASSARVRRSSLP
jgi:hypothetical protein